MYVVISILCMAGMELTFFLKVRCHCRGILDESFTDQKTNCEKFPKFILTD